MTGPFPLTEFLDLHRQLALAPGPSLNEGPRRELLIEFFRNTPSLHIHTDEAGNLWCGQAHEDSWRDALVLDAHIDVVERGYVEELHREDNLVRGLGVGDNLAAVAMLALTMVRVANSRKSLRRPLTALFSVGEEGLGNLKGVRQIVRDHADPPFLFIALDGSLGTFSMTGLGSRRYRTSFRGPGGHSWGDFGSPNAIDELVDFVTRMKAIYVDLCSAERPTLSFNIGTISGGEGINSIARAAEVTYEFRSASGSLLRQMDSRLESLVAATRDRRIIQLQHDVIGTRPGATAVRPSMVRQIIEPAWGPAVGNIEDAPMSTNINVPLAAGWPAACLGVCSYTDCHTEDETLDITSLPIGWDCLSRLLTQQLCGS